MIPRKLLPAALALVALVAPVAAVAQPRTPRPRADAGVPVDAARTPADEARRAQVVARVNATNITVGELEDLLNEAPAPIRQTYTDPARRREFLENLVTTFLLADEARRRGIDRDMQLSQTVRRILGQRIEQVAILDAITPASITDAEVRAWYDGHVTDYQQPEFRRATAVIATDRAAVARFIAECGRVRGDMRRVRELVREVSTDATSREHDGDLFYFQRTGLPAAGDGQRVEGPLAEAVFTLAREMDVTPQPVALADGRFGAAVLTGQRPAMRRTLDDEGVVSSIRGFIVRERRMQRREELLRDLRTRLHPEVHDERLELIHLPPVDLGSVAPFDPGHGGNHASPDAGAPAH